MTWPGFKLIKQKKHHKHCLVILSIKSQLLGPFRQSSETYTIRSCDCILLSCDVHFIWITSSFSIKMSEYNPKNRLTGAGLSLLSLIKKVMAKTTRADLTIVIGVHVMSGPPPWYTYNHYITTCTIKKQ